MRRVRITGALIACDCAWGRSLLVFKKALPLRLTFALACATLCGVLRTGRGVKRIEPRVLGNIAGESASEACQMEFIARSTHFSCGALARRVLSHPALRRRAPPPSTPRTLGLPLACVCLLRARSTAHLHSMHYI